MVPAVTLAGVGANQDSMVRSVTHVGQDYLNTTDGEYTTALASGKMSGSPLIVTIPDQL